MLAESKPYRIPRIARRIMTMTILTIAGFYVVFCAAVFFLQSRLIYFPGSAREVTPNALSIPFEEVTLDSRAPAEKKPARIVAWFVPAAQDRGTVLLCHGNAGTIADRGEIIGILHDLGLNVFIFDYRGYGKSEGSPTEQGLYADAAAAWEYLTLKRGIAARQIVVMGKSLGGGVASQLAERRGPGALILQSAFTSTADMGARLYPFLPVRLLTRHRYETLKRMPKIQCPVLVAHSPQDEMVPYAFGRAIFDAARQPKRFLQMRGSHNEGFLEMGKTYSNALDTFLKECFDPTAKDR